MAPAIPPPRIQQAFPIFLALQTLDIITTLLGLRLGASEGSYFVDHLMRVGPLNALLLSKLFAVLLVTAALAVECKRLIERVNFWCAALVTWNLLVIFAQTAGIRA